jgi:hypothetical protein
VGRQAFTLYCQSAFLTHLYKELFQSKSVAAVTLQAVALKKISLSYAVDLTSNFILNKIDLIDVKRCGDNGLSIPYKI